jgi:enoyl-CoA hydratase
VNKVVAPDPVMAEAERVANRICELSPMAVQGMKELMVRGTTLDYNAINQLTDWVQTRVMNSEDRKRGVKAFSARRKVDWPGH